MMNLHPDRVKSQILVMSLRLAGTEAKVPADRLFRELRVEVFPIVGAGVVDRHHPAVPPHDHKTPAKNITRHQRVEKRPIRGAVNKPHGRTRSPRYVCSAMYAW